MAHPHKDVHLLSISAYHKPACTPKVPQPRKRYSFAQSVSASTSTFVDVSPILGTPVSSYYDQNPFSDTPDLSGEVSISSSVFSTESKQAAAHNAAVKHAKELASIRKQSKGVQEYLLTKLQRVESVEIPDPIGLDYYDQELERLKDSIYSMHIEPKSQEVDQSNIQKQLNQMQMEILQMRESLSEKQTEIRLKEKESQELKHAVKSLERTVLDLGGSVDLGKTTLEAPVKKEEETCVSTCKVF